MKIVVSKARIRSVPRGRDPDNELAGLGRCASYPAGSLGISWGHSDAPCP